MHLSGRLLVATLLLLPLLAACDGSSGERVAASPRALAAVVIDHIDREPRREDGYFRSAYSAPRVISAQVDYGVNPEGGEEGETITVRATVSDIRSYKDKDLRFFDCASFEPEKCEESEVGGAKLLYRWYKGAFEAEPGNFTWTVVRKDEVVRVEYEPSRYFDVDPRTLDLPLDPDDLRAAALDPAMSLRTTAEADAAGRALTDFAGDNEPPIKPVATPISAAVLLKNTQAELHERASSSRPSTVTDFGLEPVSVHLELAGSATYDPVGVDVFTALGRTPLLDPPPCKVGAFHDRVRTHCIGVDKNEFTFWEPARGGRPGVLWIVSVHYNSTLHRPVSSAIRLESTGLTDDFLLGDRGKVRFSREMRDNAYRLVRNLSPVSVRVR